MPTHLSCPFPYLPTKKAYKRKKPNKKPREKQPPAEHLCPHAGHAEGEGSSPKHQCLSATFILPRAYAFEQTEKESNGFTKSTRRPWEDREPSFPTCVRTGQTVALLFLKWSLLHPPIPTFISTALFPCEGLKCAVRGWEGTAARTYSEISLLCLRDDPPSPRDGTIGYRPWDSARHSSPSCVALVVRTPSTG